VSELGDLYQNDDALTERYARILRATLQERPTGTVLYPQFTS